MSDLNTVAAVERNVETLKLEETSPSTSFSNILTHGRLSIKISVACNDWMINGAKCMFAIPMCPASTSHSSNVICFGIAMIPADSNTSNLC